MVRAASLAERLRSASGVGELLSTAAEAARCEARFSRAVVLGVGASAINAIDTDALADPASDWLRRRILERPIPLDGVRLRERLAADVSAAGDRHGAPIDVIAERLGLRQFVLAPVVLDGAVAAVLVLDRDVPAVRPFERALAALYASIVAILLEQRLLRQRVADAGSELRRLTTFSHALMQETRDGPIALPSTATADISLPGVLSSQGAELERWDERLTAQERRVARLLAVGRSNRDIATELTVSLDTVKSHVTHVLHKLGVVNRAQAAVVIAGARQRRGSNFTPTGDHTSPGQV